MKTRNLSRLNLSFTVNPKHARADSSAIFVQFGEDEISAGKRKLVRSIF